MFRHSDLAPIVNNLPISSFRLCHDVIECNSKAMQFGQVFSIIWATNKFGPEKISKDKNFVGQQRLLKNVFFIETLFLVDFIIY